MSALRKLTRFCEQYTTAPMPELQELERETYLHTLSPQMLCGHLQGQLLSLMSKLLQPEAILEIGTFTGYSTICLAAGLSKTGIIHTIEVNPELEYISRSFFKKTGLSEKIRLHIGDACTIIPKLTELFDLVFIDAGKASNALFFDLTFNKLKPGGLFIIDNVLWDGKVMGAEKDNDTRLIEAFNRKIHEDPRVENIMLPIRDGLLIARKLAG